MNGWFSRAAIDRIADCAVAPSEEIASGAALLERYVDGDPTHGLGRELFRDQVAAIFGDYSVDRAFQFYCFANLLELAVRTGYVDLGVWDPRERLSESVAAFVAREAASENPCDLSLINSLSTRLEARCYRVEKFDISQFNAFASLLNLETSIRNDSNAQDFIAKTRRGEWSDDLVSWSHPNSSRILSIELLNEKTTGTITVGWRRWNTSRGSPISYGASKMTTV
jgi:hypothetical protein